MPEYYLCLDRLPVVVASLRQIAALLEKNRNSKAK
jgi:hypothetical protein